MKKKSNVSSCFSIVHTLWFCAPDFGVKLKLRVQKIGRNKVNLSWPVVWRGIYGSLSFHWGLCLTLSISLTTSSKNYIKRFSHVSWQCLIRENFVSEKWQDFLLVTKIFPNKIFPEENFYLTDDFTRRMCL